MKREILVKGLVIPLALGILLGIALFLMLSGSGFFRPVSSGSVLAYHDSLNDKKETVDVTDEKLLMQGDNVGTITLGEKSFPILYKCGYSDMLSSVSYEHGYAFDKDGCTYLEALHNNVSGLEKEKISISSPFGEYSYKYKYSFTANNELELQQKRTGIKKGIVIYYQRLDDFGISSEYEAFVYEEEVQ